MNAQNALFLTINPADDKFIVRCKKALKRKICVVNEKEPVEDLPRVLSLRKTILSKSLKSKFQSVMYLSRLLPPNRSLCLRILEVP